MIWLAITGLLVLLCFGAVLLVGAPYLPTLRPQLEEAFKLLHLKAVDSLLELGCGDGKVLIAAARQGIATTGYELNPLLAVIAWLRTWRYRKLVRVIWGNFWDVEWPQADAVFTFLLPRYMAKLNSKMLEYQHKPVKLVSVAFAIPDKKVDDQRGGVYLYTYR